MTYWAAIRALLSEQRLKTLNRGIRRIATYGTQLERLGPAGVRAAAGKLESGQS